jgi:hypothetical protein
MMGTALDAGRQGIRTQLPPFWQNKFDFLNENSVDMST